MPPSQPASPGLAVRSSRRQAARLLLGGVLAAAGTARAQPAPTTALRLRYDGYYESDGSVVRIASASLDYETSRVQGGVAYRARLRVESVLADLEYESRGRLVAEGLAPQYYRERRKIALRAPKEREVRYRTPGWPSAVAADGAAAPVDVPAGTQDRVSLMVHLSLLARRDPARFRPGDALDVSFASFANVRALRLEVGEREILSLARPPVAAFGLRHDAADEPAIAVWLADDDARTPAALRMSEGSTALRFLLSRD